MHRPQSWYSYDHHKYRRWYHVSAIFLFRGMLLDGMVAILPSIRLSGYSVTSPTGAVTIGRDNNAACLSHLIMNIRWIYQKNAACPHLCNALCVSQLTDRLRERRLYRLHPPADQGNSSVRLEPVHASF